MFVPAPGLASELSLGPSVTLADEIAQTDCDFYLTIGPTSGAVTVEAVFLARGLRVPLVLSPAVGRWSHVGIVVSGAANARMLSAFIDGMPATDGETKLPPECQGMSRFQNVDVGFYCVRDSVGADLAVSFDDIRVTTR